MKARTFILALASLAALATTSPGAAEVSIQGYGDRDKTCTVWSDTCRGCVRGYGDNVYCSNSGIACQPANITCKTRRPEPAK